MESWDEIDDLVLMESMRCDWMGELKKKALNLKHLKD